MEKPFSPPCERNAGPILTAIKEYLRDKKSLLEIGSGTGQHAVYLAPFFKNLTWQPSDVKDNHEGIQMWLDEGHFPTIKKPMAYRIGHDPFPAGDYDVVFTANTLHIMSWSLCQVLFFNLKKLKSGANLIIYGPFNYNGEYTSEGNRDFDQWLKDRDPNSAIRSFEDVYLHLKQSGFELIIDKEMPANNRTLIFKKIT